MIVFISRDFIPRNASTIRALMLGKQLKTKDIKSYLLLPNYEKNEELKKEYDSSIYIYLTRTGLLNEIYDKYRYLKKNNPYYVHVINVGLRSFIPAIFYKILSYNKRDIRIILDIDEDVVLLKKNIFSKLFMKIYSSFCYKRADIILCASKYLSDKIKVYNRVHYIPYAIDLKFHKNKKQNISNDHISKIDKYKAIIYMGTYQNYFGLDNYIDVVCDILQKDEKIMFIFIGDGPNRKEIQDKITSIDVERVIFTGYIDDDFLDYYLEKASAFILPLENNEINKSRCPNKLFYYIRHKKPIITNFVGEVGNILKDKGIYYDYENNESLKKAIYKSLNINVDYESIIDENIWEKRLYDYLNSIGYYENRN